jgi:sugar phosphate isomerase/epimerase
MSPVLSRREWLRLGLGAAAGLAGSRAALGGGSLHLGLVTYNVAKEWDLDTILRLVQESGFEGVEFRSTHAHGVEISLGAAERAEVKSRCAAAGLKQVSLGSACEFHSPDPAVVRQNVDEVREWVRLARDIGARGVKVRPNGLPEGVPVKATVAQIGKALAECGEFAQDHGVEIWVEVHGRGTREPKVMRQIMDACGHPAVGLTWNSNDSDVENGSVKEAFTLLRPFIKCCHITDLWSDYPYSELFSLLQESGYDRFTLCEYHETVPAEEGAAWLRRYRARWLELKGA